MGSVSLLLSQSHVTDLRGQGRRDPSPNPFTAWGTKAQREKLAQGHPAVGGQDKPRWVMAPSRQVDNRPAGYWGWKQAQGFTLASSLCPVSKSQ